MQHSKANVIPRRFSLESFRTRVIPFLIKVVKNSCPTYFLLSSLSLEEVDPSTKDYTDINLCVCSEASTPILLSQPSLNVRLAVSMKPSTIANELLVTCLEPLSFIVLDCMTI